MRSVRRLAVLFFFWGSVAVLLSLFVIVYFGFLSIGFVLVGCGRRGVVFDFFNIWYEDIVVFGFVF